MRVCILTVILLSLSLGCLGQQATNFSTSSQTEIEKLREQVKAQGEELRALRAMVEQLSMAGSPPAKQNEAPSAAKKEEVGKQVSQREAAAERFRFGGDVRVRFEPTLQEDTPDRYRARLRVRFGAEGKLNEEFGGGFYLATGTVNDDPVSTNATLTQFFSRKTIGLDRGWITYKPKRAEWLELTGGKFSYTWLRSSLTLDPDLNPEGFSEKLTYSGHGKMLKSLSVTGMQLFFNEVAGSNVPVTAGNDSYAAGGQVAGTFAWTPRITTTVAGTALNWLNADSIAQAVVAKTLAGNRNTNATTIKGGVTSFASKFLYVDLIADTTIKTKWERWPVRILADYVDNARAASNQGQGYWLEASLGRTQVRHDVQIGYSLGHIEQDAIIAAFGESEMRAPTNVVQHRVYWQWLPQKNTTALVTGWFGRTLDRRLGNAALPPGLPATEMDPTQKKIQLDLIYRF